MIECAGDTALKTGSRALKLHEHWQQVYNWNFCHHSPTWQREDGPTERVVNVQMNEMGCSWYWG